MTRPPESSGREYSATQLVVRMAAGLLGVFLVTLVLGHGLQSELESLSKWAIDKVGLLGMTVGTWLADGFMFPIPPQAYMVMAEASGVSVTLAFLFIAVGSMLGGVSGYLVAPQLARIDFVSQAIERSAPRLRKLSGDNWLRGVAIISLTPVAFSWLCYAAALYRVPRRAFALLCLLRIPKLVLFQLIVSFGWNSAFGLLGAGS